MKRKLHDLVNGAGNLPIGKLAVGSLWAPALWFAVIALGDGSNLLDPPSERYFRWEVLYPVVSLLTAAAFVNLSLWLVRRRFPGVALTLWIGSVGITGFLLFAVGLFMVSFEGGDIFSGPSSRDVTRFTLFMSGVMASFTLPGWAALGLSHLITLARRSRSRMTDAPEPSRSD